MKTFSIVTIFSALAALASCGCAAPHNANAPESAQPRIAQVATSKATTTQSAAWNPLEKQEREADTLFLLDADEEAKWKGGEGGLIAGNEAGGDKIGDKVVVADGKFRRGYKSIVRDYGYIWLPSNGMIAPDEFTVEFWFKSDAAPETAMDFPLLVIYDGGGSVYLECVLHDGKMGLQFRHNQAENPVDARVAYDLKAQPLAANTWNNVAYTFKKGVLSYYVNGALVGEVRDIPAPRIWSDSTRGDGISIGGGYGRGSNGVTISDLRISRHARTLGDRASIGEDNVLTVSGKPTGDTIQQNLLGALHYFADDKTMAMGKGVVRVMRTDKMLTSTPIVAGAPDATHPSKGVSGKYSYDWTVVDRTFDHYKKQGVMPYISIDSTPEILGGKTPPFGEDKLKNPEAKTGWSGFTPEVPNDYNAFGDIVRDFVNHVVKERGDKVPYWGVWNEPDGPSFWSNKIEDYLKVYEVSARAVKAVDANLLVGGPETAEWNPRWNEALVKFCAENKVPLDFVSWHYYLGELTEFAQAKKQVAAWSKQYGLEKTPGLVNGEWTWQANNFFGPGYRPFSLYHYNLNDWHAAFVGASLVEMQNAGVLLSIFTNPVATEKGTGFDSSGLVDFEHPWANMNVFRLWSKMAPDIVQSDYIGIPGVWQIASRDKNGRLTILLSHLRYRKDVSPTVTIKVGAGKYKVTNYVVDDAHSNAIDAGVAHAELETAAAPIIKNGELKLTMRPRAVHLLVLEPAK